MKLKTTLVAIFGIMAVTFSHGAQLAWTISGVTSTEPFLTTGTAYLIQSTISSTTLLKDVNAHLLKYGTKATDEQKSNFVLINAGGTTGLNKYHDPDFGELLLSTTSDAWSSVSDLTSLFVLIVTDDGKFYLGEDVKDATTNALIGADYLWDSTLADAQTLGKEPLPEPTAFALLALGVAGLALRRKVK